MTTFYVDPRIGSDTFDGTSYADPYSGITDEYMYVFFGIAYHATAQSATVVSPWTERSDTYYTANYDIYIADYLATSLRKPTIATLASSTPYKHAMVAELIPAAGSNITFRSASSMVAEADASVDCTPPAGIVDGDILLAYVYAKKSSGTPTITPPAGWSNLDASSTAITNTTYASDKRLSIYWKRASSESGNYTFSHDGTTSSVTQVVIVDYYNCVATGTPVNGFSNVAYVTNNTSLIGYPLPKTGPWYSGLGATAARIAGGDTIKYAKSETPTSLGSCTFTTDSVSVTIPSGLILAVDDGESVWSEDNALTTTAVYTTYKINGSYSSRINCSAGATGKLAYKALAGATDYSGYQQLSFWIMSSVEILQEGILQVCLCSDTSGNTVVDTFNVPPLTDSKWSAITVDKGSALGSSIQSVAVYATVAMPACYIYTDTIIACKSSSSADAISLSSVISDNSSDAPPFYPVRNIVTTTVTLGSACGGTSAYPSYFNGSSGTKTGYKIEPLRMNDYFVLTYENYSATSYPKFSGGWDSTFSSQTGYTWLRNSKAHAAFYNNDYNWIEIERLCSVGAVYGVYNYGNGGIYLHDFAIVGSYSPLYSYASGVANTIILKDGYIIGNTTFDMTSSWNAYHIKFDNIKVYTTYDDTVIDRSYDIVFINCVFDHLYAYASSSSYSGIYLYTPASFYNCVWTDTSGSVNDVLHGYGGEHKFFNCLFDNGPSISTSAYDKFISIKHNQTENNHLIYLNPYDIVEDEATTRHTASGISWKMTLGASTRATSWFPTAFSIAQVACGADTQVTVSVYVKRQTSSVMTVKLVCPAYQIADVDTNVEDSAAASDGSWEQLTINFTPGEAGVVDIQIHAYGASESVYIDDISITQA